MHQVLLCIQTNHTRWSDDNDLEFGTDEFYFKIRGGDARLCSHRCPRPVDNTVKIAETCNVEFEFGNTKLPAFRGA